MSTISSPSSFRVIGLIIAGLFFTGVASAATGPYSAIVAIEGLGISNANYALILTVGSIVGVSSSVLTGWVSDHLPDRRPLILATAALAFLGQLLIWLVHEPWAYVVATCGILALAGGLNSQILSVARTTLAARVKKVEFYMTLVRAVFSMSYVVGPPIGGWIAASRTVFDAFGFAALCLGACLALFVVLMLSPAMREANAGPAQSEPMARGIEPHMLVALIGTVAIVLAQRINGVGTPLAIISHWHGNVSDVGAYAALAALFEIPCMIGWGFVVRRVPVPLAIAAATFLYAIYLTLVGTITDVSHLFWLQALNGLAIGGLLGLPIAYMQDAIRGRVGLSTSLLDVMYVVSGLITAGIFAVATSERHYLALFAIGSWIAWGGMAVMVLAWWLGRRATSR